MAEDSKKGRGSKPRVQGKSRRMYYGQNPSTYTRTVGGKAQGPTQPRSEPMYGYNLYNQYGEMDGGFEGFRRNRPRTVSSREASVSKKGRGSKPLTATERGTGRAAGPFKPSERRVATQSFYDERYQRNPAPRPKKPISAPKPSNASGKNKTYQKPSVKGRTVAPTTSGMAGRGGRRATKKP